MRNLVIMSGSSNPDLADRICRHLTVAPADVDLTKFSNGETSVTIKDSVREKDVYVIQSGCGHVNDNFLEMLIMISACKTSSAQRVTAVLPLFPYSRQPDIPYTKKGAPLVSKPKAEYTFESVPASPRPGFSVGGGSGTSSTGNKEKEQVESGLHKAIMSLKNLTTEGAESPSKSNGRGTPPPMKLSSTNGLSVETAKIPTEIPEDVLEQSLQDPTYANDRDAIKFGSNTGYREWIAQAGTLVADLLTCAGADHIITMDLHDPQFQGFFDIPVDNLYGKPLFQKYIITSIEKYHEAVIVSPDAGGAKRATAIADALGMEFALIHKERKVNRMRQSDTPVAAPLSSSSLNLTQQLYKQSTQKMYTATTMLVGDVKGKVCLLVDDLVDTSYTITRAAKLLKDQGATKVYAIITHGIFSGDAIRRIKESSIDKIITTNSTPQHNHQALLGPKLEVLDVSSVFAEAIRRIHNGESMSMLFDHFI